MSPRAWPDRLAVGCTGATAPGCDHGGAPHAAGVMRLPARAVLSHAAGPGGVLVKRGQLTRPSFEVSRTCGASCVPGSLPMAEGPCCPQAQSLALGMCPLLPP